jgi:hypothetical protein
MVDNSDRGGVRLEYGSQQQQKDDRTEDLTVLSRWVKGELFDQVKFLYSAENDLKINGLLYKMFVRDCRERLVGLKGQGGQRGSEYRTLYVQSIWTEGTKKKCNIVTDGLATRRGGIYTAMQNRFTGMRCDD